MPTPPSIVALEEDTPEFAAKIRAAAPPERRELYQQARERSRNALLDLTAQWLQHASRPEFAACEKWTLFLETSTWSRRARCRISALLYRHQDTLRRNCTGTASDLTKAVLRSPAMINYLDLQQNRNGAPTKISRASSWSCSHSASATTPRTTSRKPRVPLRATSSDLAITGSIRACTTTAQDHLRPYRQLRRRRCHRSDLHPEGCRHPSAGAVDAFLSH